MKRFHCELSPKVYTYAFVHVNTETNPVEDYFPYTKTLAENYKKMPTPGAAPKYWLYLVTYVHKIMSYI